MSIAHAVSNAADRLDRGARVPELFTQAADEDIDNVLNTVSHTVTVDDQPIELTSREREILALFLANPGRVFTRERILNKIWGSQADHLTNVNNAASGYVKALQHLMYGEGAYQSSDLEETDFAALADAVGCHGIRVETPDELPAAFAAAFAERDRPSVIDVMITRDASRMLPAVDNRAVQVKKGDRIA